MTDHLISPDTDRSADISQPLEQLHPNERLKDASRYLRGTIAEGLSNAVTGAVCDDDTKLMKFHGIYQQDDRDLRDERRKQKLEPAYQFMIRVRLAGGVCTPRQWIDLADLAKEFGGASLRLTTRQTFQFHGIVKTDLKRVMQGIRDTLLDTVAACGDDTRGIMSSVNPHLSSLHREVYELAAATSNHVIPKTRAYHEIWLDGEKLESSEPEEPVYGKTYLPRKFKYGFAIPPYNDIDVYTQDVGFIAIAAGDELVGFNVTVGGGMGRTDRTPSTYPRLGDLVGYIPKARLIEVADAILTIQRDYGNRKDRARARFKYTIDDKGLDWFKAELSHRLGFELENPKPYTFKTNADAYGWVEGADGQWHYTLFIENGRVRDFPRRKLMSGLAEIARIHKGEFRLTPNQNLIIAGVAPSDRQHIDDLLEAHNLSDTMERTALARNAMACVAFPTCGLAMAESERYLPSLLKKIDQLLDKAGLGDFPIITRMTGCPNGCARPYVAELAFTGRAPGKYNMYLGGGAYGQRLNRLYLENVGEDRILKELEPMITRFSKERRDNEPFGDFVIRTGIVREVISGVDFNASATPSV